MTEAEHAMRQSLECRMERGSRLQFRRLHYVKDVPAFDGGDSHSLVWLQYRIVYILISVSLYTPSHGYIHLHVDFDESPRAIIYLKSLVGYHVIALGASVRRVRSLRTILFTGSQCTRPTSRTRRSNRLLAMLVFEEDSRRLRHVVGARKRNVRPRGEGRQLYHSVVVVVFSV